jgi:transcription antitermination factor NusG
MNRLEMVGASDDHIVHPSHWYALQTRPRHEKRVASELAQKGVNAFLPLVSDIRQWSDRRVQVDLPLFSCYLFVNIVPTAECRVAVLQSYGALGFVGRGKEPISVPESQIEHVRRLVANKIPFVAHPFLEIGQRVRIRGGVLDGIEGILERRKGRDHLVLSVQTIQRSLSLSIEGYDVEAVRPATLYNA